MTPAANRIADFLASMPSGDMTTGRGVLKDLLLSTDGRLMAQGRLYDIKSRHIGAGVYRVWLEEFDAIERLKRAAKRG